jgi:hypothetical protein
MLASISPVGEGSRNSRWPVTVAWFVVGAVVGGTATGALLGGAGQVVAAAGLLPPPVAVGSLAAAAILGLIADRRRWLPSLRRQVDERWLTTYRGWVYGLGFGLQLGAALFTTVTASATYVVLVGAFATAHWQLGALVGGAFGLVRALPLLGTANVRTPGALRELHRRIDGWTGRVARATAATPLGVAIGAVLLGAEVLT